LWVLGSGGIPTTPIFGFDLETPFVSGFDVGVWNGQGGNTIVTGAMQSVGSMYATLNVSNPVLSILLMHFDGANESSTFTDVYGNTFASQGSDYPDIYISTTQYKFGGSSLYSNGVYSLYTPTPVNLLGFGTSDFTVEMWVRTTSSSAVLIAQNDASAFGLYINSSGYLGIGKGNFTALPGIVGNTAVNDGNWHAVCYARHGTTGYLFVDGNIEWTGTDNNNYNASANYVYISGNPADGQYIGYIDELRISPVARYTSNYTPATGEFTY